MLKKTNYLEIDYEEAGSIEKSVNAKELLEEQKRK
jgi:hypothetical protein